MPAAPPGPPRVVFFGPPTAGKTALVAAFRAAQHDLALLDTEGPANNDLLDKPALLRMGKVNPTAAAVRDADALVLLVDASAGDAELAARFRAFSHFVTELEITREYRRDVGGLPVFVTLTKCDTLFRPGDTPAAWQARVAARQVYVGDRFQEFLSDDDDPVAFGSLEVRVAATALAFPPAAGFGTLATPYGVADLAEAATAAARDFRRRADHARTRLKWTVTGTAAFLSAMACGLALLLAFPGAAADDPLAARVKALRANEGPPAVRLADRHFGKNEADFAAVRDAFGFDTLPAELKAYVDDRLAEFDAYKAYRDKFRPPRLGPAMVRNRPEQDQLAADLAGDLAPPPAYAAAWATTEAVQLRAKWTADAKLLAAAEETVHDWYRGLVRRATTLELTTAPDAGWRADITALLAAGGKPPFRPTDVVPGSPKVAVRRGGPVTYASAFESDRVAAARQDWETERDRVLDMRDLADALGFTGGGRGVLELPEPTADAAASRGLAAGRLAELRAKFPNRPGDYRGWVVSRFPDPARGEFRRKLRQAFDAGVRHARVLTKSAAADPKGTAAALDADPAARDWGVLLGLLRRLADDGTANPLDEAIAFLRADTFTVEVKVIEVFVPDDLRGRKVTAAGPFTLTHTPPGGPPTEYPFRPDGEPRRDGDGVILRYTAAVAFTLVPGSEASAAVPLRAGDAEFKLLWQSGRPRPFAFDRLGREPDVKRGDAAPERGTGVRLLTLPAGGWPAVPVLLPE